MSENIEPGGALATQVAEAEPISVNERILTLDVLRGFALFGIMFVNVYAFVNPGNWFTVPWQELGAAEYGVEVFKLLFTQGKFYTLFAFLFGLGFTIQLASAERRGGKFAGRFFWRILILWFIGILHGVFVWDGDILNTYAVGGLILLILYGVKKLLDMGVKRFSKTRDKAPRGLMLVVAALLMFGPLTGFGAYVYKNSLVVKAHAAGETLSEDDQKIIDRIEKRKKPEEIAKRKERTEKTVAVYTNGSYVDTVSLRMEHLKNRILSGPFWFTVCGIFLIGAYFGRNNFINRAQELRSGFVKLGLYSFAIGLPFNIAFVYANIARPTDGGMFWGWLNFMSKTASALSFALMFVAIITLAMLGPAKRWLHHLAPVGRMALSNYLLQSIIGSMVFYGFGLGLLGQLNVFAQIGYIVVLFSLQMVFSRWWLERYRFGPAEWLWRSLTYLKRQPMKIAEQIIVAEPKPA